MVTIELSPFHIEQMRKLVADATKSGDAPTRVAADTNYAYEWIGAARAIMEDIIRLAERQGNAGHEDA